MEHTRAFGLLLLTRGPFELQSALEKHATMMVWKIYESFFHQVSYPCGIHRPKSWLSEMISSF